MKGQIKADSILDSQAAPDSLSDNLTYFGNQYGQHSHSTAPATSLPALRDWSQGL